MDAFSTIYGATISLSIVFGASVAYFDLLNSWKHPAKEGAMHLHMNGYKVLGGGERDYYATECGTSGITRRYVVEKDGVREEGKAVCLSNILSAHLPEPDNKKTDLALEIK